MAKKESHSKGQSKKPAQRKSEPACAEEAAPSSARVEEQESAFDDQRDVEPVAIPAVEMTRTVAMLACANPGTIQPGRPIFAIAPTTQDVFQLAVSHENQLESDLVTVQQLPLEDDTSDDSPLPLAARRELIWLMGPPACPRPAIIGRALRDLGALSVDHKRSTVDVYWRILAAGPDHLNAKTTELLNDVRNNIRTASDASKALAEPMLERMAYLSVQDLAQLARDTGTYLTKKGMGIFHDWPNWEQSPAPPKPPKRELSPRRKLRKLDAASEPPAEQT